MSIDRIYQKNNPAIEQESIQDVTIVKEILKGYPKEDQRKFREIYEKFKDEVIKCINEGYIVKMLKIGSIFLRYREFINLWSFKEKKVIRIRKVKSYWKASSKFFNFYTFKGPKVDLEKVKDRILKKKERSENKYNEMHAQKLERLKNGDMSALKSIKYFKLPTDKSSKPDPEYKPIPKLTLPLRMSIARRHVRQAIMQAIYKYKKNIRFIEYLEQQNIKISENTLRRIQDIFNIMDEEQLKKFDGYSIRQTYAFQFMKFRRQKMLKFIKQSEIMKYLPEVVADNQFFKDIRNKYKINFNK